MSEVLVGGQASAQHLHRDLAVQSVVATTPDGRHATRAKVIEQLVPTCQ
jgi:hypothetical protein